MSWSSLLSLRENSSRKLVSKLEKMEYVRILIACIFIVHCCKASEPYCRQFEYDEKMLSKMIRTEVAMETLTKKLENVENRLQKTVESAEERRKAAIEEMIQASSTDGGWTNWSAWTECTTTCGGGIQSRYRSCDNPAPYLKGKMCKGPPFEHRSCSTQACHDYGPMIVRGKDGKPQPRVGFTVRDPEEFVDGAMIFRLITTNYGGNFDVSKGRFVCQVPGLYMFSATILGTHESQGTYCWIKVGSTGMTLAYGDTKEQSTYQSGSASLVYKLKVGDEVYLGDCSPNNIKNFDWNTHFTGVLIQ